MILPMLTRITRRIVTTGLLLVLSLAMAIPAFAVTVTLATVTLSHRQQRVVVMGQVKSVGHVTLTAPMTGRVVGPFLPAGVVAAGAVIARIDPPGLEAQIQAARARAIYARIALRRSRRLFHDGVVARATMENRYVAWQQATARWRALLAQQQDESLTAPFAGNLNYRIAPGGVVTAGTAIATLDGRGRPWIQVRVPPPVAVRLSVGALAGIQGDGWRGHGRIRSIGRSARQSGLVAVVIAVAAAAPLLPGEWVAVHLHIPERPAFTVPIAAIVMHGAQALVFSDDGGRAHAVAVRIVGTSRHHAWIRGALKVGEHVVVQGVARLSEQSALTVRP